MSLRSYLDDDNFIKWLKVNYSKLMRDNSQRSLGDIIHRLRSSGFNDSDIVGLGRAYHFGANDILVHNP